MAAVLSGFATLGLIVSLGYILGRLRILDKGAEVALSRLGFSAAIPALMFLTVSRSDIESIFSAGAIVNVVTVAIVVLVYLLVARFVLGQRGPELTFGALSASYVNAGNLGIPILVFAVGDATAIARIILLQYLVMMPIVFAILDLQVGERNVSFKEILLIPLRNPPVVGVGVGILFAANEWQLPELILSSVELVGDLAVPTMLIAFGLSLRSTPMLGRDIKRTPLLLAISLKTVAAPAIAYLLASKVVGITGLDLLGTVIVAALPTAQGVFIFAMRYGKAVPFARDCVLLSTLVCIPVVVTLAGILA